MHGLKVEIKDQKINQINSNSSIYTHRKTRYCNQPEYVDFFEILLHLYSAKKLSQKCKLPTGHDVGLFISIIFYLRTLFKQTRIFQKFFPKIFVPWNCLQYQYEYIQYWLVEVRRKCRTSFGVTFTRILVDIIQNIPWNKAFLINFGKILA